MTGLIRKVDVLAADGNRVGVVLEVSGQVQVGEVGGGFKVAVEAGEVAFFGDLDGEAGLFGQDGEGLWALN